MTGRKPAPFPEPPNFGLRLAPTIGNVNASLHNQSCKKFEFEFEFEFEPKVERWLKIHRCRNHPTLLTVAPLIFGNVTATMHDQLCRYSVLWMAPLAFGNVTARQYARPVVPVHLAQRCVLCGWPTGFRKCEHNDTSSCGPSGKTKTASQNSDFGMVRMSLLIVECDWETVNKIMRMTACQIRKPCF